MTLLDSEKVWVMPLCDIPLEPSYKNPVYFDEKGVLNDGTYKSPSRATFFEKYDSDFSTSGTGYQEVNFELGDTINTSVTLEINDTHKLIANYLHVIWSKVNESSSLKKLPNNLFYFVKSVKQLTTTTFKYQLELDVITTYSPYLHIRGNKPLFTERKHCNRWGVARNVNNKMILPFKTGASADVLLGDDIDGRFKAEKLVKTSPLTNFNSELPIVHDNLRVPQELVLNLNNATLDIRNVKTWLYVHILRSSSNPTYSTKIYKDGKNYLELPFATFIAPLDYWDKTNNLNSVLCDRAGTYYLNQPSAKKLYDTFVDDVNLLSIRISNINPYSLYKTGTNAYTSNYKYIELEQVWQGIFPDGDGVLLVDGTYGESSQSLYNGDIFWQINSLSYNAVNTLPTQSPIANDLPTFNYTDFNLGDNKNNIYEPKLYTTPFYRYGLKLQGSDIKDYDKIMAFDNGFDDINVTKQGLVTPESQKVFYSIDSGVYKDLYKSNIGLTFNPPYSLPMINDVYKNFLATQSNQQLQSVIMGTIGSVAQIGLGIATAGVGTSSSAVVKGIGGASGGVFGGINSITQYFAKRQDMKNAPDSITNAGQSTLPDYSSQNYEDCYVIEYDLVDKEKEMVADYFYENGYKVNRECVFSWDLSSINPDDCLITRTLFNFVMIADESFINNLQAYEVSGGVTYTYTLSPAQRNMVGSVFAKGVCLWTLYGVTTGNDIDKYYLSKQYENIELLTLINYQYLTFSMTFSGCTVGVDDAYISIGFDIDELTFAWDDIMLTAETGIMSADELTNFIYETITNTDPVGSWYEANMSLLSQFDVFVEDGKIIFRSKTYGVREHTFYTMITHDFSVDPTLTFNVIQEGI